MISPATSTNSFMMVKKKKTTANHADANRESFVTIGERARALMHAFDSVV